MITNGSNKKTSTNLYKEIQSQRRPKKKKQVLHTPTHIDKIYQDKEKIPLEEVYPQIAEYYNTNELDCVNRGSGKYRWRITLTAMSNECGVTFVDEPVQGTRFILHSDGLYGR